MTLSSTGAILSIKILAAVALILKRKGSYTLDRGFPEEKRAHDTDPLLCPAAIGQHGKIRFMNKKVDIVFI